MPEESNAAIERLFRERRLLLGVSIVLLAHQLLGIKVGQGAETLGLHFEIDNPERLFWGVWLVWLWAFVCYAQQLNSLRPLIRFPRDRRTEVYQALGNRFARWTTTWRVRASFRRQVTAPHRTSVEMQGQHRSVYNTIDSVATKFQLLWKREPDDPRAVNLLDTVGTVKGWFITDAGDLAHVDGTRGRSGTVWVPVRLIEGRRWLWLLAVTWTWATTSFATDYVVPLGIGLAPPVIAGASFVVGKVHEYKHSDTSEGRSPCEAAGSQCGFGNLRDLGF